MMLVTGTTGIGRALVRQLSETGGGNLILVSDKSIPDAVRE